MSLWAIIPVKPLRRGKSRLAGVLSEEERTVLNITLLENTLRTLKQVQEIDQILVVSRDTGALALARDFKARTVQEGKPGLNTALKRATIVAQAPARLVPGGWLLLEHGWDQAAAVRGLLAQAGLRHIASRRDLAGIERCSGGQWAAALQHAR